MDKILLHVLQFLFGFGFQFGNAAQQCSLPPESHLIYIDLEQLSLMKLQQDFADVLQSSIVCTSANDKACDDQPCCTGEVGCCYTDSGSHIRTCGCRKKGDTKCTYPAPLAVLGKSECNAHEKRDSVACLIERREEDYILGKNSIRQPVVEAQPNLSAIKNTSNQAIKLPVQIDVKVDIVAQIDISLNREIVLLQNFTGDQLADKLNKTVIDDLIQYVQERKRKGLSYGISE